MEPINILASVLHYINRKYYWSNLVPYNDKLNKARLWQKTNVNVNINRLQCVPNQLLQQYFLLDEDIGITDNGEVSVHCTGNICSTRYDAIIVTTYVIKLHEEILSCSDDNIKLSVYWAHMVLSQ